MIFSGQTLRKYKPVAPFKERTTFQGMTYGLGPAGYDVRLDQNLIIPSGEFVLGSTMEQFNMPTFMLGIVHDKSSLARCGIALQNTVIEPGWRGFLTLEISNHSNKLVELVQGMPIAQIIFHSLDEPAEAPYEGKYQNQVRGPQRAKWDK